MPSPFVYAISTFIQLNLPVKKFVGYTNPDPSKHKFFICMRVISTQVLQK